jgi:2-dehydropantoate 2-reductase
MRFVVYGAGAIGSVVGARLLQSGRDVVLIARGAHREAIVGGGLTLETPRERTTLRIPVVGHPDEIAFAAGDVVLLTTKSQDTEAALEALRAAAPAWIPVVCTQNGVENERIALRRFENVYGAVVMSPTGYLEPGVVQAYGASLTGAIDIGCYPSGVDQRCRELCVALSAAQYDSEPRPEIMRYKHAKLLTNLGNAVQAICGPASEGDELGERAREEGRAALRAAGIAFDADFVTGVGERWKAWEVGEIAGRPRGGGSTWQSVARRAGSVESDYLNGEIVLRGRQTGTPTPLNALLQELMQEAVRERHPPGWLTAAEVLAKLHSSK